MSRHTLIFQFLSMLSFTAIAQNTLASDSLNKTEHAKASLCPKSDTTVFSCSLKNNKKIVSICASLIGESHRFYYFYGNTNKIELTYPPDGEAEKRLFLTRLPLIGSVYGISYSFVEKNIRYIAFDVDGTGFKNGGVIAQRLGSKKPLIIYSCDKSTIQHTQSESLIREAFLLPFDDDLKLNGISVESMPKDE